MKTILIYDEAVDLFQQRKKLNWWISGAIYNVSISLGLSGGTSDSVLFTVIGAISLGLSGGTSDSALGLMPVAITLGTSDGTSSVVALVGSTSIILGITDSVSDIGLSNYAISISPGLILGVTSTYTFFVDTTTYYRKWLDDPLNVQPQNTPQQSNPLTPDPNAPYYKKYLNDV